MLLLFYDELPQLKISRSSHQRCSGTGVLIYFSKFHRTSERLVLNSKKLIALQILHFQTVIIGPNQTGFYRLSTGILKNECRVKDPGKWGILFNLWLMGFNRTTSLPFVRTLAEIICQSTVNLNSCFTKLQLYTQENFLGLPIEQFDHLASDMQKCHMVRLRWIKVKGSCT